jgi:hypothetical protein
VCLKSPHPPMLHMSPNPRPKGARESKVSIIPSTRWGEGGARGALAAWEGEGP